MALLKRHVVLSPDAVRQYRALPARARATLKNAMRVHLEDSDAMEETRNRFRLRRPSEHADFELRVEQWRVFYRVIEEEVCVVLIGRKRGSHLIVGRKKFVI